MQSTTPMDPRALDSMMEYQLERYGNPHSRTHAYGWESEAVVEKARKQVADLIGASPKEVLPFFIARLCSRVRINRIMTGKRVQVELVKKLPIYVTLLIVLLIF